MSYDDTYYCPHCGAILNDQPGFDPDDEVWTCTECGRGLYGDDIAETMTEYDGIVWYCDSCGAVLNKQDGFYDYCRIWRCTECGHFNSINEDEIYESEEDYQSGKRRYTCPECGAKLRSQWEFDDNDNWTCTECGTRLCMETDGFYTVDSNEGDGWDEENDYGEYSSPISYTSTNQSGYQTNHQRNPVKHNTNKRPKKTKRSKVGKYLRSAFQFLMIVGLVGWVIMIGYYEYTKLVPVLYSPEDLIGTEYKVVAAKLRGAGFTSVSAVDIPDLKIQDLQSEYIVTEVKIGWITSFSKTTRIPSNIPVVVTFHTLERILVPMSSKEAKGQNYEDVIKAFRDAGFINIETDVQYDIITGWLTDDGEVESVIIGDLKEFSSESVFRPNEDVVITYHTLKKYKPG